jgi:hypothetical protein
MDTNTIPTKVHLVGSIGLDNVEEVFSTVGKLLGRRLRRVPDGEPGGRRLWISWQYPLLRANPFLRADPAGERIPTNQSLRIALGEGVSAADVRFGELGYAREARASYLDFLAAKKAGQLPAEVRFQVCLPTALAVIFSFCSGKDVPAIEPAYEKAMIREVEAVCRAIPHKDLCIQWDVCTEMVMWDGQLAARYPASAGISKSEIMARLVRLAAAVPADVELGIHLCYGDFDGRHFVDPQDAGAMVDLANEMAKHIGHPLAYIHMPVPVARSDEAFFQPLRDLRLKPGTELYLGVVHAADGAEGARKRIAAASRHASGFGIATECGMARARKPDVVTKLLEIHAEASREP